MPKQKKPTPRRPRGTGGLAQRKTGPNTGLWIPTYNYEDEYGEKKKAYAGTSMDRVIANQNLRDLITEIENGTYQPGSKMTVAAWFKYWLEEIIKPNKAPGTYKSYNEISNNQIIPFVGDRKLPVTSAIIRGNLKRVGEKWSPRTAELTFAVWSVSMKTAKREGVIKSNPVENVIKPPNNTKSGTAHTTDEARKVLMTAQANGDRMVTRWAMAYFHGARQGECLGMERTRINMSKLTMDMSWKLESLRTKPGADLEDPDRFVIPGGFEIRPLYRRFALTKRKGDRPLIVPIPVPLAAIFEVYLKITDENAFDLMWASLAGNPIDNKTDSEAWHAALALAKVPDIRLHDARHTTATLLLEMGVDEKVRMDIMGQSSLATQRRYAHVDLSLARKALGNLDCLLELG